MNLRRKITPITEYTERPYREVVCLFGIVNDLGIEHMCKLNDETLDILNYLKLRCRYNTQRNSRIFICIIKKEYVPDIFLDPKELYVELKKRAISFNEIE